MGRLILTVTLCILTTISWTASSKNSQSLFDVYIEALEKDPRVKISIQKIEVAKARYAQSRSQLLPQANLYANFSENEVQYNENTPFQVDSEYDGEKYSFVLRQTLFNWQILSNRAKMSEMISKAESEQLEVMGQLLVDVVNRYFSVLATQNNLDLIRAEKKMVREQLQQVKKMYDRKLVRIIDLLETEARADTVRTDEIDAENSLSISREALAELTGGYIGDLYLFSENVSLPEIVEPIEVWVELALKNNALLKSKRDYIAFTIENISEQKGGLLPKVDLILSDQVSDVGFDNLQSPKRKTNYIGIDVSIPIFSGGGTSARIREAYAQKYIAQEEMEGTRRAVLKNTREAYLNAKAGLKRIKAAELGKKSATRAYEAMKKSFSYGTVTAIDVLEALHKQTKAISDYQMSRYNFASYYLTLKKEGGTINQDDLVEVSSWLQAPSE
tara:strand:- start:946 stop:2280 length:1335 start_codon:yes stop_codon:yes gene_type:complete